MTTTIACHVSDDERAARAQLMRAELANHGHVRDVGPEQALADIRRGAPIAGVDVARACERLHQVPAARELELAVAIDARIICPGDDEWPAGLADLEPSDSVPLALWVRGHASLGQSCQQSVAVVGSRVATDYGATVATDLAAGLAKEDWTVVSGLAFGIDAAAHRGSLANDGCTVAVVACGVNVSYPSAHRELGERIVDSGAVVSEYPPGTAPSRFRFLLRNRLIAALSVGTVLVEAAVRSGSRSTARHAGELGRQVMAVPGPVTSMLSAGCHQLLRDDSNAVLVTNVGDVLEQVRRAR